MSNVQNIHPPAVIGILGGGQLGRMLALSAREMGYGIVTLDPQPESPCGQVADEQLVAEFDEVEAAGRLAEKSDVVVYEFENITSRTAQTVERQGFLPQGWRLLHISQNRLREKRAIQDAGISVAPYLPVSTERELFTAIETLGCPGILKTVEGGYDGKGQWVIAHHDKLADLTEVVSQHGGGFVYEKLIDFRCELSVVVARNSRGETLAFPVAENIHHQNILHLSIVPARIPAELAAKAEQAAKRIAEAWDLVGLLALEMFLTAEGEILINEVAPRPHNSGHYTQDACLVSQFEQMIRAVCGLPLVPPKLTSAVAMVNVLGRHYDAVCRQMSDLGPEFRVHLYGKREARPNRKMGHVNVCAVNTATALDLIAQTGIWRKEGMAV